MHYYKFPQQLYCPYFSISLFDFFIVIARSPDVAKLVANRYSVFLSTSQNAITLISNTDSSATKQPWLSSNIWNFDYSSACWQNISAFYIILWFYPDLKILSRLYRQHFPELNQLFYRIFTIMICSEVKAHSWYFWIP